MTTPVSSPVCVAGNFHPDLLTIRMVNDMFVRARTMSIKDGDRLPHRRISTGSDLMKCGDRMIQKGYNGFIKIVKGKRSKVVQTKKQY